MFLIWDYTETLNANKVEFWGKILHFQGLILWFPNFLSYSVIRILIYILIKISLDIRPPECICYKLQSVHYKSTTWKLNVYFQKYPKHF